MLKIIRASAGSGKTHRLTGYFLDLVLKNHPLYFKEILGVTFTNKATGEMKRRLLRQLHILATENDSPYYNEFIGFFGGDAQKLREKSTLVLKRILHEYSWLNIETIDTFFQRIIRSFTRELGIPGNYSIEIETLPALNYAVDHLLDSVEENQSLLSWLTFFIESNLLEGKQWDIKFDLLRLGKELFKEDFSSGHVTMLDLLSDRDKLLNYRSSLYSVINSFESTCKSLGTKALESISHHNLDANDFYLKSNGPVKFFRQLVNSSFRNSKNEIIIRTGYVSRLLQDTQCWPSSDTRSKSEVLELVNHSLHKTFTEAVNYIQANYRSYFTAVAIRKNLYTLGILIDLASRVREYRLEKNVFILSDAPVLLERIINQNDTPFIYEKAGNRFAHFLMDEFQDTSRLQWKNFKPLLSNSLSQEHGCLIVGDVKQSVYRWRNSDWQIFANLNDEFPPHIIDPETLSVNYRSCRNIVLFNSALFSIASHILKDQLQIIIRNAEAEASIPLDMPVQLYTDCVQGVSKDLENCGHVLLKFFEKKEADDSPDYYVESFVESLNGLLSQDYSLNEIAILVRTRHQGKVIADLIIEMNANGKFIKDTRVVSEESLFISSSNAVNMLLSAMQYLATKEKIYLAKLICLYEIHLSDNESPPELILEPGFSDENYYKNRLPRDFPGNTDELLALPLYEMTERLVTIFSAYMHEAEIPYIHALLDMVHDYTLLHAQGIHGFIDFWSETGNTVAIASGESENAIRILTIHKAKGLGFRAVLIPFCDWKFANDTKKVFWVKTPSGQFNAFPIVPVDFSKQLEDTFFAADYYDESFRTLIDNLNLLYVAFTRPVDTLIVFSVFSDDNVEGSKIKTAGDLLFSCITNEKFKSDGNFDREKLIYTSGVAGVNSNSRPTIPDEIIIPAAYVNKPATTRLYFNDPGFRYFAGFVAGKEKKLRGSSLHNLLAGMDTLNDLEKALTVAKLDGTISDDEAGILKEHILWAMNNPLVKSWFDDSGRHFTEREILTGYMETKRPDRVVVWDDRIHIIDYKFSSDIHSKLHLEQVRQYMQLVKNIEGKKTFGFLWYVDNNEIMEVEG